MKTLTCKGFGIFNIDNKMTFVDFAKTKKEAMEKVEDGTRWGEDIIVYEIEIFRAMRPIYDSRIINSALSKKLSEIKGLEKLSK